SIAADVASKRTSYRLYKNLIGDDGRIYICSGKNFFSFESNGSIAWTVHLNYTCNSNIAPINGGSKKIYLVAENRVLKIYPLRIGTSEAAVELFFGPTQFTEKPEDIIGISASISSSCVLINVKNRGLFAYRLHGQLLWSAGPVLYQHGFRQGCRKNITECYFTSSPVIDHCEASIFVSIFPCPLIMFFKCALQFYFIYFLQMCNTVGELYSLSVRGPYFKWIQDLSSFGNKFIVTPGNNGRLYVTVPGTGVVLALDVSTGNILWRGDVGPLSSADYEPVVDSNGWISFGSLDGSFYSFSPTGDLKRFPRSASLNSVIQVSPVLDCSGYGVYISQTEMEGKAFQTAAEYVRVSALKPKSVAFTLLVPSSGSIYLSESDPVKKTKKAGKILYKLSQSDLQHFVIDERTLLAFFAVSRKRSPLPCRSTRQKLASSCSQVNPKTLSIYSGNERTIVLFLLIESVILVLVAALVQRCCVFWKKKKLQSQNLGKFLEKRRSLRSQKKAYDRMIYEIEEKAASDEAVANEVLERLSDLVKEREDIKRKLSTSYSLGRDDYGEKARSSKSALPLYDEKTRSYSIKGSKNESVTVFHTVSDSSSNTSSASEDDEYEEESDGEKSKGKAHVENSSDDEDGIRESGSRSLRRRTVSFTN
ncbi:PREDICTED: LOW QUALITY PROTEIN: protein GAMETE EXPRESSED 3, partial [Erythranthe guttata]|uniref:LOW QUALITY PROTEIN: protein GAMETE EXPRESSED 3 n=1 Tax=Erythranthe guttata TaxID=4155 RepID=UPI00064DCF57